MQLIFVRKHYYGEEISIEMDKLKHHRLGLLVDWIAIQLNVDNFNPQKLLFQISSGIFALNRAWVGFAFPI